MEHPLESTADKSRNGIFYHSLFWSAYLELNRESIERLRNELRERNFSDTAIDQILGFPEKAAD